MIHYLLSPFQLTTANWNYKRDLFIGLSNLLEVGPNLNTWIFYPDERFVISHLMFVMNWNTFAILRNDMRGLVKHLVYQGDNIRAVRRYGQKLKACTYDNIHCTIVQRAWAIEFVSGTSCHLISTTNPHFM